MGVVILTQIPKAVTFRTNTIIISIRNVSLSPQKSVPIQESPYRSSSRVSLIQRMRLLFHSFRFLLGAKRTERTGRENLLSSFWYLIDFTSRPLRFVWEDSVQSRDWSAARSQSAAGATLSLALIYQGGPCRATAHNMSRDTLKTSNTLGLLISDSVWPQL